MGTRAGALKRWAAIKADPKRFAQMRRRVSKAAKEEWQDSEYREKQDVANATPERKASRSENAKRVNRDPKHRANTLRASKDPERCAKVSKAKTEQWKDPEFRAKMVAADREAWKDEDIRNSHVEGWMRSRRVNNRQRPTSLERKAIEIIIEKFGYKYRYVGDGRLIVNGRCPDFVHTFFKHKLIEVYGSYYHSETKDKDAVRIKDLRSRGYKVLVLWDKDFNVESSLHKKLRKFHSTRSA